MRTEPEERSEPSLAYTSLYLPGAGGGVPPLLLLHGSNGDERDLLELAEEVRPGASRLAVRGDVSMQPGWAFFRRFPDRQVDVEDLRFRASRLAGFVGLAAARYEWRAKPVAVGYSNGAIMALAMLLDSPSALAGAILLRPLLPFDPSVSVELVDKPVLIVDGHGDRRRSPQDGALVREAFQRGGASVQHGISNSGHALGQDDVDIARTWISRAERALVQRPQHNQRPSRRPLSDASHQQCGETS